MKEVGKVTHYYPKIGVAVVKLKAGLAKGDKIAIKGKTANFEQVVESMQVEHAAIEKAKKGQSVGLKVGQEVHEGDGVYK